MHYRETGEEAVPFDGVDPVKKHGIDTARKMRMIRKLAKRFRREHRHKRY